ncbi:MAG TPA: hypothetical protein VHX88_14610, partial [Solirubrobacteraceae bacterium]|nr:hypothetical protein [Solirubrobacteraceae bacterium]
MRNRLLSALTAPALIFLAAGCGSSSGTQSGRTLTVTVTHGAKTAAAPAGGPAGATGLGGATGVGGPT